MSIEISLGGLYKSDSGFGQTSDVKGYQVGLKFKKDGEFGFDVKYYTLVGLRCLLKELKKERKLIEVDSYRVEGGDEKLAVELSKINQNIELVDSVIKELSRGKSISVSPMKPFYFNDSEHGFSFSFSKYIRVGDSVLAQVLLEFGHEKGERDGLYDMAGLSLLIDEIKEKGPMDYPIVSPGLEGIVEPGRIEEMRKPEVPVVVKQVVEKIGFLIKNMEQVDVGSVEEIDESVEVPNYQSDMPI